MATYSEMRSVDQAVWKGFQAASVRTVRLRLLPPSALFTAVHCLGRGPGARRAPLRTVNITFSPGVTGENARSEYM